MTYVDKTWADDDVITAVALNNIQGNNDHIVEQNHMWSLVNIGSCLRFYVNGVEMEWNHQVGDSLAVLVDVSSLDSVLVNVGSKDSSMAYYWHKIFVPEMAKYLTAVRITSSATIVFLSRSEVA